MNRIAEICWRKSSYSNGLENCLEIGEGIIASIPVRDSKIPNGNVLRFTPATWFDFIESVKKEDL